MTERNHSDIVKAWEENPLIIKQFIDQRGSYLELCSEISHIVSKHLLASGLKIASITSRAKELDSFIEKLERKEYSDPFVEITDFAGVRVVYLYKSERTAIEEIIEKSFHVIEKVNKVEEQENDKFGYGALHYLVKLNDTSSGARYDGLKKLVCEIQVKTILQDAWALVAHNMSYKKESDVPKELIRKLNSLSGLFETADDYFDFIRADRDAYLRSIEKKVIKRQQIIAEELNLDTFQRYVTLTFPDKKDHASDSTVSRVLGKLLGFGYNSFEKINELLDATKDFRDALNKKVSAKTGIAEIARAMAIKNPGYSGLGDASSTFIEENRGRF